MGEEEEESVWRLDCEIKRLWPCLWPDRGEEAAESNHIPVGYQVTQVCNNAP